jgi:hypothetical protein
MGAWVLHTRRHWAMRCQHQAVLLHHLRVVGTLSYLLAVTPGDKHVTAA